MTLDEKYRYRSQKNRKNLSIYVIIALFFTITATTARYANEVATNEKLEIAKWNITINGETISPNKTTLDTNMPIIIESGSADNIIRNGDTGYFEIEVNPTGTEVSVEYIINLSFVKQPSTILSNMKFEYYSLNDESQKHTLQNNTIDGTASNKRIVLNGKSSLDATDKIKYKVYWKWEGKDLNVNPGTCSIKANVQVRQVVS